MKVYVIEVHDMRNIKLSQEGYKTLEQAQAFIESKSDKPIKLDEYNYRTKEYTFYVIREVRIV